MLTNEDLLQILKAQIATSVGGQASAQDAQAFIDLSVEQIAVLNMIRTETNIVTSRNLDSLDLGDPAMVAATEGTDPDSADVVAPTINRATLTPTEVLLAYDVTFDFLRKNIEGEMVNDSLNKLFAKRFGKDLVILAFNGDTSLGATSRLNKCKRILDGYYVQAAADASVHDYTISGNDYLGTIFPGMLAEMPKDYKDDRGQLAYFVSPDVYEEYAMQIGERVTALGDAILFGDKPLYFRNIQIVPVYQNPDGKILLTIKNNLAVGYGQNMTIGRDIYNRTRTVEVTITASVDAKYAVSDAVVLGSE